MYVDISNTKTIVKIVLKVVWYGYWIVYKNRLSHSAFGKDFINLYHLGKLR